jgi:hypothetical protein
VWGRVDAGWRHEIWSRGAFGVLSRVAMRVTLDRAAWSMRQTEESKQFFFAKKNQKTLVYKALSLPRRVRQMDKSFCFFFQKEVLSSCRCLSLKATWY